MGYLAETSQVLLLIVGLFMILIILLQRGRGGGLAGAFGGMGGQSAFGTRAGDVFTKITCGIAVAWVILAGLSGLWIDRSASAVGDSEYKSESELKSTDDASKTAVPPGGLSAPAGDVTTPAGDAIKPEGTAPATTTSPAATSETSAATTPATDAKPAETTPEANPATAPAASTPAADESSAPAADQPAADSK